MKFYTVNFFTINISDNSDIKYKSNYQIDCIRLNSPSRFHKKLHIGIGSLNVKTIKINNQYT